MELRRASLSAVVGTSKAGLSTSTITRRQSYLSAEAGSTQAGMTVVHSGPILHSTFNIQQTLRSLLPGTPFFTTPSGFARYYRYFLESYHPSGIQFIRSPNLCPEKRGLWSAGILRSSVLRHSTFNIQHTLRSLLPGASFFTTPSGFARYYRYFFRIISSLRDSIN